MVAKVAKARAKNRIAALAARNGDDEEPVSVKPKKGKVRETFFEGLQVVFMTVRIIGRENSPLVMHKWSEKAKKMIRERKGGRKTKDREPCDPEQEAIDATHLTLDGKPGIPAGAFRKALINAAHRDKGITKVLTSSALFIHAPDQSNVVPIKYARREHCEDPVRIGNNQIDLRYRPYFWDWSCEVTFEVDQSQLRPMDVVKLLDMAGFGVGLLEFRPEKHGDYGRFFCDPKFGIQVSKVPPKFSRKK